MDWLLELSEIGATAKVVDKLPDPGFGDDLAHSLDDFTAAQWMPNWTRNAAENLQIVPRQHPPTITHLRNVQWGAEAVLLASGPSVDDAIAQVKRWQTEGKQRLVFVGNSTASICAAHGITPDWLVILDSDAYVPQQLAGIDLMAWKTIIPTMIDPEVPKILNPELTWWFNVHDPRQWLTRFGLHHLFPEVDALMASSCVVGAMARIAHLMGIRRTYLLGADFSYPGGRHRCSRYEKLGDRWISEGIDPFCEDKSEGIEVDGIQTTRKLQVTHAAVLGILKDLETKGLEVISCSKGLLREFPMKSFEEVADGG